MVSPPHGHAGNNIHAKSVFKYKKLQHTGLPPSRELGLATVFARAESRRKSARELANVGYWPLADIPICTAHVRFWPMADMGLCTANVCFWPKADIGSPQCAEDIRQCLQSQDVDRRPRYASGALPLIVLIGVELQKSEGAPRMYAKKNLCEATHIRFARPSAIIWVRHA